MRSHILVGKERTMRRIADFFGTIFSSIAGALSALGHAPITIVTAPFRALAKLFRWQHAYPHAWPSPLPSKRYGSSPLTRTR
jgi:hypothetical protein